VVEAATSTATASITSVADTTAAQPAPRDRRLLVAGAAMGITGVLIAAFALTRPGPAAAIPPPALPTMTSASPLITATPTTPTTPVASVNQADPDPVPTVAISAALPPTAATPRATAAPRAASTSTAKATAVAAPPAIPAPIPPPTATAKKSPFDVTIK
jgi:hypothetical protein